MYQFSGAWHTQFCFFSSLSSLSLSFFFFSSSIASYLEIICIRPPSTYEAVLVIYKTEPHQFHVECGNETKTKETKYSENVQQDFANFGAKRNSDVSYWFTLRVFEQRLCIVVSHLPFNHFNLNWLSTVCRRVSGVYSYALRCNGMHHAEYNRLLKYNIIYLVEFYPFCSEKFCVL